MLKNGNTPPPEPADYEFVDVTLSVQRTGWEVAEQFARQHGMEPLQLISQAVEQRLDTLFWLMDHSRPEVAS